MFSNSAQYRRLRQSRQTRTDWLHTAPRPIPETLKPGRPNTRTISGCRLPVSCRGPTRCISDPAPINVQHGNKTQSPGSLNAMVGLLLMHLSSNELLESRRNETVRLPPSQFSVLPKYAHLKMLCTHLEGSCRCEATKKFVRGCLLIRDGKDHAHKHDSVSGENKQNPARLFVLRF